MSGLTDIPVLVLNQKITNNEIGTNRDKFFLGSEINLVVPRSEFIELLRNNDPSKWRL
jgi:hypothetical protein